MTAKNQDKIVVEISADDNAPDQFKQENLPRLIKLTGHTAAAFREMHEAGFYGVYKRRIDLDALARFDQLAIPYRRFHSRRDTGDARKENWLRLDFPNGIGARIVSEGVA